MSTLQILELIAPEFSMPIERECPTCHGKVAIQRKECPFCHTALIKTRGRPKGTTAANGYNVGGNRIGRPKGTTEARGFNVGKHGGRPKGTTAARGFGVGRHGGRPKGTTAANGHSVGGNRVGRPTAALRINVGKDILVVFNSSSSLYMSTQP